MIRKTVKYRGMVQYLLIWYVRKITWPKKIKHFNCVIEIVLKYLDNKEQYDLISISWIMIEFIVLEKYDFKGIFFCTIQFQ